MKQKTFFLGGTILLISIFSCVPAMYHRPMSRHITCRTTKIEMVLVPAGDFIMGSAPNDPEKESTELPQHTVFVDAFYIDTYETSVVQFKACVEDSGYKPIGDWQNTSFKQTNSHPVVEVSWWDAIKYCNWRSRKERRIPCYNESTGECDFSKNGYRLPTEVEWEKAARGTKGIIFPWGNAPPLYGGMLRANYAQKTTSIYFYTAPVNAYEVGKSPYGIYQMAGNVSEWCNDWYDSEYYKKCPRRNPRGPSEGKFRVLRGGFWFSSGKEIRTVARSFDKPCYSNEYYGFRCVRKP